jgi:hypothetical protein
MSRTGFSLSGFGLRCGFNFGFELSSAKKKAHRLSFTLFGMKSLRY